MAVDKDQRKCCLVLLLFVYNIVVCLPDSVQAAESDTESGIVERVSRRQFRDVYFFINSSTIGTNCGDKNTYLISEERCVKDEELFGAGCSEAIIPTSSLHLTTILLSVLDRSSANVTHLLTGAANGTTYIETFKFNETSQLVNSSLCDISSLEVYRGRDQAIEISYQGFSLSDNGSIKITIGRLGYDLEDYFGELYRMNLSCSGGGLPESGCLFFKVTAMGQNQQNSGYVTNAKFNCTVSGTRYDFIEECNNITTGITADTIPEMTTASVVSTLYTTTDDIEGQIMIIDFDFVYVLAGLGGGILILILLVVAVCTCFCIRLAKRKRQTFTFTAAPSHNVYSMEDVEQPHDAEMLEGNELLTASRPTVLSDFMIVSEDTGHVYAVLEQTPSQQPTTIAQSNETASTEQTEQTHLMETAPNNEFQYVANQTMGLKSRSATWASGQQSNMGSKPACKNLELVQIHDNMTSGSEMEGGTVTDRDRDNGPSHPGNHRKHSLPTNLGEHQRSIVNATQDRPTSNGPKKKPDEPIYSQPDMNKKREERRKKGEQKEQEERTAASRKVSFSNSSCPPLSQATELERREVERRKLENEPSIGSAAVDGPQQTDTSLFGKQLNNNPDDKLLTGKDERLYDEPISLNVFPKKSKSITEKEEGGKENFGEE